MNLLQTLVLKISASTMKVKAFLLISGTLAIVSVVPISQVILKSHSAPALIKAQTVSTASATPSAQAKPQPAPAPKPAATQPVSKPKPTPPPPPAPQVATNRINFPNNKVGVHIYANLGDISLASSLINTNGGDWGWVTFTFDINDRSTDNWNIIFSTMKAQHLSPILQLFNHGQIPTDAQTDGAADFLTSVSWPTKIRVITAYNEVNAAEYWGGRIDPEGYARVLNHTVDAFKSRSPEFFIMNGAFNPSARTGKVHTNLGVDTEYLSIEQFLARMNAAVPGIFKKLDGWAAHTYPQPEYLGKPLDTSIPGEADWEKGRNTMSSYKWELNILRNNFGVVSPPVFITETGWPHKEGTTLRNEWLDAQIVASYYKQVFEQVYLPDSRVIAVTPFVLKQIGGVDNFSFTTPNGGHYPQWDAITSLGKVKGNPPLP